MTVRQLLELANETRRPPSRNKFPADRIGADQRDGVPLEIMLALGNRDYHIRIVGKDNVVGALVTHKKKSYNVRLSNRDLDALGKLKSARGQDGIVVKARHTRDTGFVTHKLPNKHETARLLHRIIAIYNLPEYSVQPGDTFSDILEKRLNAEYALEDVLSVNPGLDIEHLHTGQRIKLPATAGARTPHQ